LITSKNVSKALGMPKPHESLLPKIGDIQATEVISIARNITAILGAISLALLVGCDFIGPRAIQYGRIDYNDVIQKTNKQQTFVNIIRVAHNEPTAFMDVSEVDSVVLAQASLTGSIGGVGAGVRNTSGATGMVGGSLEYQEQPTIRYAPLLGQALVSQLSTPITAQSLSYLMNSGWPASAVLDFACDNFTPNGDDRNDALDKIQSMWESGALAIVAGKTQTTKPPSGLIWAPIPGGNASVQVNQTNSAGSDAGSAGGADSLVLLKHGSSDDGYWRRLQTYFQVPAERKSDDRIILKIVSTQPIDLGSGSGVAPSPVIYTRSALGVLKTAIEYYLRIYFVTPEMYKDWYRPQLATSKKVYYRALPGERDFFGDLNQHPKWPHRLLVIGSGTPPSSRPYVMHFDAPSGKYFYIAGDDIISQTSFTLLNLFLIIQATAAPAPLTPTISVGAKGS
jgi:hypothetical protein